MVVSMLNEQERKRVYKQCLYPCIALASLAVTFFTLIVGFIYFFIDDFCLNADEFYSIGMWVWIGICMIGMIIYSYCILSLKIGKKNRAFWASIVQKVNAKQYGTDYSQEVATALGMSAAGKYMRKSNNETVQRLGAVSEVAGSIEGIYVGVVGALDQYHNGVEVAKAIHMSYPKVKKYVVKSLLIPFVILTVVYVPEWIHTRNTWQNYAQEASVNIYKVRDAFEQNYEYVSIDDPLEKEKETYDVYGHPQLSSKDMIHVAFDKEGKVTSVSYNKTIDVNLSMDENLQLVQEEFDQMNEILVSTNVEALDSNLLTNHTMSTDFQEQFKAGTYYKELDVSSHQGNVIQFDSLETYSEEEIDDYTKPTINHYVYYPDYMKK